MAPLDPDLAFLSRLGTRATRQAERVWAAKLLLEVNGDRRLERVHAFMFGRLDGLCADLADITGRDRAEHLAEYLELAGGRPIDLELIRVLAGNAELAAWLLCVADHSYTELLTPPWLELLRRP